MVKNEYLSQNPKLLACAAKTMISLLIKIDEIPQAFETFKYFKTLEKTFNNRFKLDIDKYNKIQ